MESYDLTDLVEFIKKRNYSRIGIDGICGVGKSTLAKNISTELNFRHINLDDYLIKHQCGFLSHLKYEDLRNDLVDNNEHIVEGICLLEILKRTASNIDLLIYVKRINRGLWADERECQLDEDVEEFLRKEKELVQLTSKTEFAPEDLGMSEEVIRYHAEHRPHKVASCVYMRKEC
jgi:hypothetical protein